MTARIEVAQLQIADELHKLLVNEIIPGSGIAPEHFWTELSAIARDFAPRNRELIERRESLQRQLDRWLSARRGEPIMATEHADFLREIGYLMPAGPGFEISTGAVDIEIADLAGPQLVVPLSNARYSLNAANARWGSLYDALYGSDVIPAADGAEAGPDYNPVRGARVVAWANQFLDAHFPIHGVAHADVSAYSIVDGALRIVTNAGDVHFLVDPVQFAGYRGEPDTVTAILLCRHGLHIEIAIDRQHPIGRVSNAGVRDIVVEAAITTIQDCEDSVAAVDARDKAAVYRNWLGLMKGDLEARVEKDGHIQMRSLNPDRHYTNPAGESFNLPGRSLMLIRNVGLLMTSDAILLPDGSEIFEGVMDCLFTALIALHDLRRTGKFVNSRVGNIYIVKPKMHGPEEVQYTVDLFARTEQALGLPVNTIKLGIMDEERRTTLNLGECIRVARERLIFINTGFLDRTGDEIHSAMEAGAMLRKGDMRRQPWMLAYEQGNVDIGLSTGLRGRAQIGKGMWAMPDEMAQMVKQKIVHPQAGASTAWVPSPTAATLHALHYHKINVRERQGALQSRHPPGLAQLLELPLLGDAPLSAQEIEQELENNAQSILGYVVRWIDQGVGCSKVPDINNVGLMEDRATLRISSQHIANWLHHGLCSAQQVRAVLEKMAVVVDQQNARDPAYQTMAPGFYQSIAFQTARDLIFRGREQPGGYTEPLLHLRRRQAKGH